LAKDKVQVPLTFELGWQRQETKAQPPQVAETAGPRPTLR
jgi:hypothetical protein